MKRKSLIVVLIVLFCLFFTGLTNVSAAGGGTVRYTIDSATAVKTSGVAPSGSNATFKNTYTSDKQQITKDNSQTLTLSGFEGCKITGITLSMKSNASKGSGSLSVKAGNTTLASIGTSAFNNSAWYGSYSSSFVKVKPTIKDPNYVIKSGENVVIVISATVNSLYCEYFEITYAVEGGVTVAIDETNLINSIEVGEEMNFSANVENFTGNIVWKSSNPKVADFGNGAKANTLSALTPGVTEITAVAGDVTSAPYKLTVYSHANDLKTLVSGYYGTGEYTKKTEIFLNESVWNTFETILHKKATPNRTTYYSDGYLLMGDFNGTFDSINSGYMNNGSNMDHFEFSGSTETPIKNQSTSVKDTLIEEYYVALDDMIVDGFFDGFTPTKAGSKNSYSYTIQNNSDSTVNKLVYDFLWFTAPGLSDMAFSNDNGLEKFIPQNELTLVVEEIANHGYYYGSYLSLRIVLDPTMIGFVKTEEEIQKYEFNEEKGCYELDLDGENGVTYEEELILAEARVYKGLSLFDETQKPVDELYEDIYKDIVKYSGNYNEDKSLQASITANATHYKEVVSLKWYKLVDEANDIWEKVSQIEYNNPAENQLLKYKVAFEIDGEEFEIVIDVTLLAKVDSITKVITIADVAAANGWANSTKYTSFTVDSNITISLSHIGNNSGKYYSSGNNWRLYQTENPTLTITSTNTIISIAIEYSVSNTGCLVQNGNKLSSGDIVEVNDTTVSFTVGNTGSATNGQARITKITIVYAK